MSFALWSSRFRPLVLLKGLSAADVRYRHAFSSGVLLVCWGLFLRGTFLLTAFTPVGNAVQKEELKSAPDTYVFANILYLFLLISKLRTYTRVELQSH